MITTKVYKKFYLLLLLITAIPYFLIAQKYKKAYDLAEEDYMKGRYFDAEELYKSVYNELDDSKSNNIVTKPQLISKMTDCELQMGSSGAISFLKKCIKSGCIDSVKAMDLIHKQEQRIARDTLLHFIRYEYCDDCNAGYWRVKRKYRAMFIDTTKIHSGDTCLFEIHFVKNKNKKVVEKADTTFKKGNECGVDIIRLPPYDKPTGISLFKIDSLGSKCMYINQGIGVDVTDLPAGLYYLWVDSEDKVERITVHLK
jgi:hypothetical protein